MSRTSGAARGPGFRASALVLHWPGIFAQTHRRPALNGFVRRRKWRRRQERHPHPARHQYQRSPIRTSSNDSGLYVIPNLPPGDL